MSDRSDMFRRWWVSQHGRPPLPTEEKEYEAARLAFHDLWNSAGLSLDRFSQPPEVEEIDIFPRTYLQAYLDCAGMVLHALAQQECPEHLAQMRDHLECWVQNSRVLSESREGLIVRLAEALLHGSIREDARMVAESYIDRAMAIALSPSNQPTPENQS